MNWNDVPVLVTGAAGFIGSHLVDALAEEGARVRAFVRYTSRPDPGLLRFPPPAHMARVEIVRGDLRDAGAVADAMDGCEIVLHLGALIGIPYSYLRPREVVEVNALGTLNILEAARRHRPRRLVHTSTSEVYGTAATERIREDHALQGQSPYSASKIAADKLVESYRRSFDVPAVTVRPFNTYGPRQSARAVIPTIITQALSSPEIRLGSVTPTRDLTFVEDTVRGFMLAATADDVVGREINLGSDAEISIGSLADRINHLVGRSIPIVQEEQRTRPGHSEVQRLHADSTLARERLGWEPRVSLDDGLTRTIAWVREHLDFYRVGTYEV